MLITIHPDNPQAKFVNQVCAILEKGGTMIYPTDSLYGLGCALNVPNAIQKICKIRGLDPKKANLTLICSDIKQISNLAVQLDKSVFKALKRNTPGPITFILPSARALPKQLQNRKQTLGFRIVDNTIVEAILEQLGSPLVSISFKDDQDLLEYPTDPYEIHEQYEKLVDLVVDGGIGSNQPSTVVSFQNGEPEIIRQGIADFIES